MGRNILYVIIGALIVIVAGFVYYTYQQNQKPAGIELKVNKNGISVDKN